MEGGLDVALVAREVLSKVDACFAPEGRRGLVARQFVVAVVAEDGHKALLIAGPDRGTGRVNSLDERYG